MKLVGEPLNMALVGAGDELSAARAEAAVRAMHGIAIVRRSDAPSGAERAHGVRWDGFGAAVEGEQLAAVGTRRAKRQADDHFHRYDRSSGRTRPGLAYSGGCGAHALFIANPAVRSHACFAALATVGWLVGKCTLGSSCR